MMVQDKLGDKIIKMKFDNTAYVSTTNMTLVSSVKLIKQGYDRDMHTKTLVNIAIDQKVCDIEEKFGVMLLEYNPIPIQFTSDVEYGAPITRNAIVAKSATNEVLNEASNDQKNEMLIDQAPKEKEEMENPSRPTTNSEQITHEKIDREHTMKFYQSNEGQRKKPTLNNPHPFRQDSGGGDDITKAPKPKNGGPRGRFTKAPNIRNGGPKKQAKPPDIEVRNAHHKDPNRTEKA
jgi:hypothetical protein